MIGERRRPAERPDEAAGAALDALRRLRAAGTGDPVVLGYWPVDDRNPFQELLYGRTWAHGIGPVRLGSPEAFDGLAAARPPLGRAVLHVHWTGSLLRRSRDPADAERTADAFLARLDRLLAAGVELAWTVHNELPHETRFPAADARIQQGIADRARVVHVLSPATVEAVAGTTRIRPEVVLEVPHPSYAGAYPDTLAREAARQELDLEADAMVYLLLGGIRPYKGITLLLEAFEAVAAADPRRVLLVAGRPRPDPEVDAFLDAAVLHPAVRLHARAIAAEEMQVFLRAADVQVLPYRRILNSGALMLGLTFGLPGVLPDVPGLRPFARPEVAVTFTPDDAASLAAALVAAEGLRGPSAAAAARVLAEAHRPEVVAEAFAGGLRERLG